MLQEAASFLIKADLIIHYLRGNLRRHSMPHRTQPWTHRTRHSQQHVLVAFNRIDEERGWLPTLPLLIGTGWFLSGMFFLSFDADKGSFALTLAVWNISLVSLVFLLCGVVKPTLFLLAPCRCEADHTVRRVIELRAVEEPLGNPRYCPYSSCRYDNHAFFTVYGCRRGLYGFNHICNQIDGVAI